MLKHSITHVRKMHKVCRIIQACFVLHNIAQKGGDFWREADPQQEDEAPVGNGNHNEVPPLRRQAQAIDARLCRDNLVDNYFTIQRN